MYEEITSPPKPNSSAIYPIIIKLIPETIIEMIAMMLTTNPLTVLVRLVWANKTINIAIIKVIKTNLIKSYISIPTMVLPPLLNFNYKHSSYFQNEGIECIPS